MPTVPKPLLKWAGGKTKLAPTLATMRPERFDTYHEPFLGGGAMFFYLYREKLIQHAVLSDANAELIDTYIAIRDCVSEVIKLLSHLEYSRERYYAVREQDPWQLSLPERAARMIYLNKTGFNGLYRVNRQGKFNVSFGRYKSPKYLDAENLLSVSAALRQVELYCSDFSTTLDRAKAGDWVYCDPPYVPISETANFVSYCANGFGQQEHERLRDMCIELTRNGVYVMVSNSDTEIVRKLYCPPFRVAQVRAKRTLAGDGCRRGDVSELVITNY